MMNKYRFFNYLTNRQSDNKAYDQSMPVGIVLWNQEEKNYFYHFVEKSDKIDYLENYSNCYLFMDLIQSKIKYWTEYNYLPHSTNADLRPWMDDWWAHVKKILVHNIVLSDELDSNNNDYMTLLNDKIKEYSAFYAQYLQ